MKNISLLVSIIIILSGCSQKKFNPNYLQNQIDDLKSRVTQLESQYMSTQTQLVALDEVFQSFYKNNSDSDWSASLLTSVEDSYNSYLRNHLNPN